MCIPPGWNPSDAVPLVGFSVSLLLNESITLKDYAEQHDGSITLKDYAEQSDESMTVVKAAQAEGTCRTLTKPMPTLAEPVEKLYASGLNTIVILWSRFMTLTRFVCLQLYYRV